MMDTTATFLKVLLSHSFLRHDEQPNKEEFLQKILFFFFVLFYKVFFIKKREKNFVLKIDEIDEIYSENAKKP